MVNPVTPLCEAETFTITIATDDDLSAAVNLGGRIPCALITPAAWTAANITFQVSHDGVTYVPLYNYSGSLLTLTGAASRYYALEPFNFYGARYLKIATTAGQGADRDIIVMLGAPQVD